jgi:GT2 family glycosyltransferase
MALPKTDYAITFACYGQLEYTKQCVDSMVRHGTPLDRFVVVDNASKDATRDYLAALPLGGRIYNSDNLGCGVAWNQGALALQAEWTIVMNNDVLVSAEWVDRLIAAAKANGVRVISPSLVEGKLDYDFDAFAPQASTKMRDAVRLGWCHAVCLAVHRSVWMDIGYFQPVPKLLGYEDTLFFHEMDKGGVQGGTTGASWLHHFGSMTLTAMKQERGLKQKDGLGDRYNYKLLGKSWLQRKLDKLKRDRQLRAWRDAELAKHGMTMHGVTRDGTIEWD